MNILLIVNESPWASTLASTAQRFLLAALENGSQVPAVFFQGDGVYNALPGRACDGGADDLTRGWIEASRTHGVDLMLCSAAAARRWQDAVADAIPEPFREAGLGELIGQLEQCSRVVSF